MSKLADTVQGVLDLYEYLAGDRAPDRAPASSAAIEGDWCDLRDADGTICCQRAGHGGACSFPKVTS